MTKRVMTRCAVCDKVTEFTEKDRREIVHDGITWPAHVEGYTNDELLRMPLHVFAKACEEELWLGRGSSQLAICGGCNA